MIYYRVLVIGISLQILKIIRISKHISKKSMMSSKYTLIPCTREFYKDQRSRMA